MNERTAEEKLRQTLEGDLSSDTAKQAPKRVVVRRAKKIEPVAKAADSFMEDFEKKIAQSLSFDILSKPEIKKPAVKPASRIIRKPRIKREVTVDTPVKPVEIIETTPAPALRAKPAVKIKTEKPAPKPVKIQVIEPVPEPVIEPEESQPVIIETPPEPVEVIKTPEPELILEPEPQEITIDENLTPEPAPEPEFIEPEPEPEILEPTPEESFEPEPEPELPTFESEPEQEQPEQQEEIEISENEDIEQPEQELQLEPEETEELPEIPLISENKIEVSQDVIDNEDNIDNILEETQDDLPEIPVISADEDESQESEAELEAESESEAESEQSEESQEPETFSPSADLVLNVAEEIPTQPESENEGGSVPVSVEMPETTKTAEDKLMADIAEAMTGNPVSLETPETLEPYKIPEEFLNEDPSKQSAENKLLANIAQAISESPLEAAADNAAQNFEDELESLSEKLSSVFPGREEPLTEEIDLSAYEADEPEATPEVSEPEPEKPETEIEATFDEVPLPEPVDEPEPEPAEEPEFIDAPIEAESPQEEPQEVTPEETEQAEIELENPEIETPSESAPEIPEIPEVKNQDVVEAINDDDSESLFDGLPPELLGAMSMPGQDDESEDDVLLTASEQSQAEPEVREEISSYSLKKNHKEIPQENELSNNSLLAGGSDRLDGLNEISPESNFEDNDEDFDINSLGALSGAMSFATDEPEPEFDSNLLPDPAEEAEREKTKDLRGILDQRKQERSQILAREQEEFEQYEAESKRSKGKILMPLCFAALLGIGGFAAWQVTQFTGRLMGDKPALSANSNPSYEYAVDFIFDSNLSGRMAQRGRDGWQVVGSRKTQDSITGQSGYELIFMRETGR